MEVQGLRCIPRYSQEWGKGALTAGVPWMNEVPQSCRGPRPWLLESQRPLEMQQWGGVPAAPGGTPVPGLQGTPVL